MTEPEEAPAGEAGSQGNACRPPASRPRGRLLPTFGLVFALATTAAAIAIYRPYAGGIDDADITFAYARNIADGHGFVYNVGGERVEGSTSLLWTLLCAATLRLGGAEPVLLGVCVALCFLTQVLVLRMLPDLLTPAARRRPASPWIGLYWVMVFSSTGYVTWMTTTLMDITLWGTLLAAAAGFVVRPPRTPRESAAAGTVWLLLCLTRPDAILLGPVFAVLCAWRLRSEDPAAAVRTLVRLGGVTALALVGLTLFRLAYFGWPLPNTYYAKVSASRWSNLLYGSEYVASWMIYCPLAAIGTATAIGILAARLRATGNARRPGLTAPEALAYAALAIVAVPLATGGDHFAQHRFLQPAYPLLCLTLIAWCRNARLPERYVVLAARRFGRPTFVRGAAYAATVVLLVVCQRSNWFALPNVQPLLWDFRLGNEGRAMGERLTRLFADEPLPSLGVIAAGGIARTYPGEKFDLMGLNDVRMAHSPGDRSDLCKNHSAFHQEIFYASMPDMVLVSRPFDDWWFAFQYFSLREILSEPKFLQAYAYGRLHRRNDPDPPLHTFYRRDWLARLLQADRHEFTPDPSWENFPKSLVPIPAESRNR